jgi:iron complex outermembrane receptor protein
MGRGTRRSGAAPRLSCPEDVPQRLTSGRVTSDLLRPISGLTVALAALLTIAPAVAAAAPTTQPSYRFDVPAGPLAQAVNRLALQSGRQVLFSPEIARGKWTQAVSGTLPLPAALDRLLSGSGLAYSISRGGMIVLGPAPPAADDPPPSLPGPRLTPTEPVWVEALVVTPGLAEAPANVERLNAAALDRTVTPGLRDVARLSSSLNALPNAGGDLKLALRGVYGAGEATTPLYFAGLPISGPSGTTSDPGLVTPDLALVDIDHLDVLRGPQGVDHGAGAIGGELRIAPRDPLLGVVQGEIASQVSSTRGGHLGYQLSGVLNVPVGEDVAVRGVAYSRRTGGYVDNVRLGLEDTNDDWADGGRLAIKVRPSDTLSVDLFGVFQRRGLGDGSGWNKPLGAYRSDRYALNWNRQQIGVVGANVRRETAGLTLSSATAWYDWRLDRQLDSTVLTQALANDPAGCMRYFDLAAGDCSADQLASFAGYVATRAPSALVQRTSIQAVVEELRAEHETADDRWVAGLFYEGRSETARSAARVIDPATGAVAERAGYTGLRRLGSTYQQVALYGEAMHNFTPRLSLTAGLRYAATQRAGWSDVLVPNILSGSIESVPKETRNGGRATSLLRAEYRWGEGRAYLQASTGSRPGGVNTTPDPAQTVTIFKPDTVVNFEAGVRRSWLAGALTAEAAAFRICVDDMQFAANTPNGAFGYVVNIGKARINGAEAALRGRRGAFTLDLNAAVTDARLVGSDASRMLVRGARAGDAIPNIPRYRSVATLSWRHGLANGASVVASWQDEYRSAITSEFRPDDPYYIHSPSYLLDTASVSIERGPVTLTAAVRNIFDVQAVDRAVTSAFGSLQTFSATPRTVSLMLRRRW